MIFAWCDRDFKENIWTGDVYKIFCLFIIVFVI